MSSMDRTPCSTAVFCAALILVSGCDEGTTILPPQPPLAVAGSDTVVAPDSFVILSAAGSSAPDSIVAYEWQFGSTDTFVMVSAGDTSIAAPHLLWRGWPCVLRITSASGSMAQDTMRVTVSWLKGPNGGEVYRVGDSLHVDFFPVDELVGLKLIVNNGGEEFLLNIPGVNNAIVPIALPRVSFVVPASIYDAAYGGDVTTISDSCLILVHRYSEYGYNISSADYFAIRISP